MTPKQRQAAAAKIRIGCQQLGIDDDGRRQLLVTVGRVVPPPGQPASSKHLTPPGFDRVIEHLQSRGAQFIARPQRAGRKPRATQPDREGLLKKISAFLAEAQRPTDYADGIAKRMFKVERLEWCDAEQLRGIVAALHRDAERKGRPTR